MLFRSQGPGHRRSTLCAACAPRWLNATDKAQGEGCQRTGMHSRLTPTRPEQSSHLRVDSHTSTRRESVLQVGRHLGSARQPGAHQAPLCAQLPLRLQKIAAVRPQQRLSFGDDRSPCRALRANQLSRTSFGLRHARWPKTHRKPRNELPPLETGGSVLALMRVL